MRKQYSNVVSRSQLKQKGKKQHPHNHMNNTIFSSSPLPRSAFPCISPSPLPPSHLYHKAEPRLWVAPGEVDPPAVASFSGRSGALDWNADPF